MKFKILTLKELYQVKKNSFLADINYFEFFDLNRDWLVPYAAFCFLRDKYQGANFAKWKSHKTYNEAAIQKLVILDINSFIVEKPCCRNFIFYCTSEL